MLIAVVVVVVARIIIVIIVHGNNDKNIVIGPQQVECLVQMGTLQMLGVDSD